MNESLIHPFKPIQDWLNHQIIGQEKLIDSLLIALLADGHLLVEGAPGLAKTRAIQCLARVIEGDFQRIQFTPDLLPGDITGTDIYRPETGVFEFQSGPVFHNLILADEINRAPAKVQSALLEAMAERTVSIGNKTFDLPALFLVMATQNPIEQEGTYVLPEAQLDRFLMHVTVAYPNADAERKILRLARDENKHHFLQPPKALTYDDIAGARRACLDLHMADSVEEYIVQLVLATRNPRKYEAQELAEQLEFGASPRASIALDRCARAHAWLNGYDYVSPDDVQAVAHNVLRHRIIPSFSAEAQGIGRDDIINTILQHVPVQ